MEEKQWLFIHMTAVVIHVDTNVDKCMSVGVNIKYFYYDF